MKVSIFTPVHRNGKFSSRIVNAFDNLSPSQPQYSWAQALRKLGVEVQIGSVELVEGGRRRNPLLRLTDKAARILTAQAATRGLERHLRENASDVTWISANYPVTLNSATLKAMRDYRGKIVLSDGLSPVWTKNAGAAELSRHADLTIVNSDQNAREYVGLGAREVICLPFSALDRSLFPPTPFSLREFRERPFDIGFVGSLGQAIYADRINILETLVGVDLDLAIWAPFPPNGDALRDRFQGSVARDQLFDVYRQCRMVVNIHGKHMADGGNLSTYEISGSGALQLIDAFKPGHFVDGKHLVKYRDVNDLVAKLLDFAERPRDAYDLAVAGAAHTHEQHGFEMRISELLGILRIR